MQDPPVQGAPPQLLSSHLGTLALALAVVAVAFLMNRFARDKRKDVRRAVVLLALYLLASAVGLVLGALRLPGPAQTARVVADALALYTAICTAGLVLFDLLLPAVKVRVAKLVMDLAVGGAYIVATLVVMRRGGVDLSGIVATSAVVTGILALSLQATLGNVVGGVALQLDDSIRVGDWIQLENGKQGRVREIRWRHTVVETRDWDTIVVPNAYLLSAQIVILGKRQTEPLQHRMWVRFNVDFRFNPADVTDTVERALRMAPIEGVATRPPPDCVCLDFAKEGKDSFTHYAVRFWLTDIARDDPAASRVRERIYSALKRAEIPLAVPAAQIWVEQDTEERRERKHRREIDRRKQAVSAIDFLKPLREDEMASIADHLRYAPFAAGETITKQGAVAHWLYILTEGAAEVRVTVDGSDRSVARIEAPGFFGEMGLMTGAPRSATVVAVTDVECYRLEKDAFHKIVADRPEVAAEISALLARRDLELAAAKGDAAAGRDGKDVEAASKRILGTIQRFFGLSSDDPPRGRSADSDGGRGAA